MTTRQEHSYGIIPLRKSNEAWEILIVQLHAGHWGFPKGHPEPQETPLETAKRELFEETGLIVSQLLSDQELEESYIFKARGDLIYKKVTYYLAEVHGQLLKLQDEIKDLKWVPLSEAVEHVTFDQSKNICRSTAKILK